MNVVTEDKAPLDTKKGKGDDNRTVPMDDKPISKKKREAQEKEQAELKKECFSTTSYKEANFLQYKKKIHIVSMRGKGKLLGDPKEYVLDITPEAARKALREM